MAGFFGTEDDALKVVGVDGMRLKDMPREYRDNKDIVIAAIKNGTYLEFASYRLQNDAEVIMEYAHQAVNNHFSVLEQMDYAYALFCAEEEKNQVFSFSKAFQKNREFMLELKRFYKNEFHSPFPEYDDLDTQQIDTELDRVILGKLLDARQKFYHYVPDDEHIHRLSDSFEFGSLLDGVERYNNWNKPFSYLLSNLEWQRDLWIEEKEIFCSVTKQGSFPERYLDAFLTEMKIKFIREVVFPWSTGWDRDDRTGEKRYDFYLPKYNAIIEVNGSQHYETGFEELGGRTLEEEQKNDCLKKEMAIRNGIKTYITIDARKSKEEFIQNSILRNKELMTIVNGAAINWKAVKSGMIVRRNIFPTPICDIRVARVKRYIRLLKSILTDIDYVPRAFEEKKEELTKRTSKRSPIIFERAELVRHGFYETEMKSLEEGKKAKQAADYQKAISYFAEAAFISLCGIIHNGDDEVDRKYKVAKAFPYSTSDCRVDEYISGQIAKCQYLAEIGTKDLTNIITTTINSLNYDWLRWHMFTREECAKIIIGEVHGDSCSVNEIYENALDRTLQEGFAEINPSALNVVRVRNLKPRVSKSKSAISNQKTETGSLASWKYGKQKDGNIIVKKYNGLEDRVSIPETINGKVVSAIAKKAFFNNTEIKSIMLPKTVLDIGEQAFTGCTGLADENGYIIVGNTLYGYVGHAKEIIVPNYVERIESEAFKGCKSVRKVEIPGSIVCMGNNIFEDCENLSVVSMLNNQDQIPNGTFSKCKNLESVVLPPNVQHIGIRAFCNCSSLKKIYPSDGLRTIGERAFYGCKSLELERFPMKIMSAGPSAFSNCRMPEIVEIPDSMEQISDGLFDGALNVVSIHLPDTVIDIGRNAFARCKSLSDIDLPETIENFGSYVFYGCKQLKNVSIPPLVKEIGAGFFEQCNALEEVTVLGRYTTFRYQPFEYCKNVRIRAYEDSAAQYYAISNKFEFTELK